MMQPSVEILAGKCNWDGRLVTPDTRKGKLVVGIGEDGLTHVQWICRTSNAIEENLIVISDAYLQKVEQAKTGRVYVLRFTSSDEKLLYWMQNADTSKDVELVQKFNSLMGSPVIPETPETITQAAASPPAPHAASTEDSSMAAMAENFVQIIQQLPAFQGAARTRGEELFTHLPPGLQNLEGFLDSLRSPQLTHNMNLLTQAIYSEQLLPTIMSSMEIPYPSLNASSSADPMEILIDSLESSGASTTPLNQPCTNADSNGPSSDGNEQDDVKMGNDDLPSDTSGG
ncbi:putative adhesion regulating molecule region protein [Cardiosporidium cionae]|uniref:Adhesion regulating molecule region protein n=1 Tax=Cardiosporidium cionae TaxID=476202 RepID=A0ABQ7JBG7_9APIC|nr:putative adhesion regulating molecule region protein [Cardiosporidium cionae]|eukprot:KAF8821334.1 putative adhesion regulating molecule region protein [Cardiosporidium cionae]